MRWLINHVAKFPRSHRFVLGERSKVSFPLFIFLLATLVAALASEKVSAGDQAEVFVQLGHSGHVTAVAISSDGRWGISGSDDRTIKLWELATGRELRTIVGHDASIESVALSPDGRYAVSGGRDQSLKLWKFPSGRNVWSVSWAKLDDDGEGVRSVAFSPDGRFLLAGGEDGILRLLEVATAKAVRTFKGHRAGITAVAYSRDGRYALSGSWDQSIIVWEVTTGRAVQTFEGADSGISCVAFSPDGRYVLSGERYTENGRSLKLWDMATGKLSRVFEGTDVVVYSGAFSPDGHYVLSGESMSYRFSEVEHTAGGMLITKGTQKSDVVKLWEVTSGRLVRTFKGHGDDATSVVFSPDGRYALSGSRDKTLALWNIATGEALRTFGGHGETVESVALFAAGSSLLVLGEHGALDVFDLDEARHVRTLSQDVTAVAASWESDQVLTGNSDNRLILWDGATGEPVQTFEGHEDGVLSVALSHDGQLALSGSRDGTLRVWEVATGNEIRSIVAHEGGTDMAPPEEPGHYQVRGVGIPSITSVALSADGKYALSLAFKINEVHPLKLWDIATGEETHAFTQDEIAMSPVGFSPDGRYAISGTTHDAFKLWNLTTKQEARTFIGHEGFVTSAVFSRDGRSVLSGSTDGTIKLWRVATGQAVRTFVGHDDTVTSVALSPDGRYAISGSSDNTTRVWSVSSGKELAKLVRFTDGEWIVITPEGYYTASAEGDTNLNVRIGDRVYGIDQYRATFYKPQVVEAALRLGDTQQAIANVLGDGKGEPSLATIQDIEAPAVVVTSPTEGATVSSPAVRLALHVEDKRHHIKWVKVYVQGRPVTSLETRGIAVVADLIGVALEPTGLKIPEGQLVHDLQFPVRLEPGENLVEVVAFNGFAEGRTAIRLLVGSAPDGARADPASRSILWFLAIGVNGYQDSRIKPLSYAVADAEALVGAFMTQKGKRFRDVRSLLLTDQSPIKPTAENIRDQLQTFFRQAGPLDVVLLFLAGHGVNDEQGKFYFLPSDAVILEDGSVKPSKAISAQELQEVLNLPAKKLLFIDACHSQGVGAKKTRAVDNDRLARGLLGEKAVIFTSSRGQEQSLESDQWRHGAFTYALLKGLEGEADFFKEQTITMKELDTYVSKKVAEVTNRVQTPTTITPEGYVDFVVAAVK